MSAAVLRRSFPFLHAIVVILSSAVPAGMALADLRVPGDFPSAAAALAAIEGGVTSEREVVLERGTWNEAITLSGNLPSGVILRGEETARTVVRGGITVDGAADARISNFTFTGDGPGVLVQSGTVTVASNIFRYTAAETAVSVVFAQPRIVNNVFEGGIAIDANQNVVTVESNAFVDTENSVLDAEFGASIASNAFVGVEAVGADPVTGDPLFVDADAGDFHLREGSPLIDAGIGSDGFDGSTADIGAYGGEFAESVPSAVQGLEVVSVDSDGQENTAELRWSPNRWYLTGGYLLYYDTNGGAPYQGAGIDQGDSPIDVGDVTGVTLSGLSNLDPGAVELTAPELAQPQPRDRALELSWSAVADATGYLVHYRADGDDEDVTVDVGDTRRHTLTGLDNGVDYRIRVSAYAQGAYYFAVTAYAAFDTGLEGEFSDEALAPVGPRAEGPLSNEVVDFPEAITAFPGLPDENGCFIATAAYGFYGAGEVRLLRRFRDHYLIGNAPGRAFVAWYYEHSPRWAQALRESPALKPLVRAALLPAIALAAFTLHVPLAAQGALLLLVLLALARIRRRRTARAAAAEATA